MVGFEPTDPFGARVTTEDAANYVITLVCTNITTRIPPVCCPSEFQGIGVPYTPSGLTGQSLVRVFVVFTGVSPFKGGTFAP